MDERLISALKAASAQASNAAYFLEHRDDPELLGALAAGRGITVDERVDEVLGHWSHFVDDVNELLARRELAKVE